MSVRLLEFGDNTKNSSQWLFIGPEEVFGPAIEKSLVDSSVFLCAPSQPSEIAASIAKDIYAILAGKGVKTISVFGAKKGALVAGMLAIEAQRMVRRLVLYEPIACLRYRLSDRIILQLDKLLPFGLPLGLSEKPTDTRPFLHRIHCPVLVLCSMAASPYEREQGMLIIDSVPNAWKRDMSESLLTQQGLFSDEAKKELRNFLDVPSKRSRKGTVAPKGAFAEESPFGDS